MKVGLWRKREGAALIPRATTPGSRSDPTLRLALHPPPPGGCTSLLPPTPGQHYGGMKHIQRLNHLGDASFCPEWHGPQQSEGRVRLRLRLRAMPTTGPPMATTGGSEQIGSRLTAYTSVIFATLAVAFLLLCLSYPLYFGTDGHWRR